MSDEAGRGGWGSRHKHLHTTIRTSDLHLKAQEDDYALKKWFRQWLFCSKWGKKTHLVPHFLSTQIPDLEEASLQDFVSPYRQLCTTCKLVRLLMCRTSSNILWIHTVWNSVSSLGFCFSFLIFLNQFDLCVQCFACMYVYIPRVCLVYVEFKRGHRFSWNGSYRWL